jgi:hypothetical protein
MAVVCALAVMQCCRWLCTLFNWPHIAHGRMRSSTRNVWLV